MRSRHLGLLAPLMVSLTCLHAGCDDGMELYPNAAPPSLVRGGAEPALLFPAADAIRQFSDFECQERADGGATPQDPCEWPVDDDVQCTRISTKTAGANGQETPVVMSLGASDEEQTTLVCLESGLSVVATPSDTLKCLPSDSIASCRGLVPLGTDHMLVVGIEGNAVSDLAKGRVLHAQKDALKDWGWVEIQDEPFVTSTLGREMSGVMHLPGASAGEHGLTLLRIVGSGSVALYAQGMAPSATEPHQDKCPGGKRATEPPSAYSKQSLKGHLVDLSDEAGDYGLAQIEEHDRVLFTRGTVSGDIFRLDLSGEDTESFDIAINRRQRPAPVLGFLLDLLDNSESEQAIEQLYTLEEATEEDREALGGDVDMNLSGYSAILRPFDDEQTLRVVVPLRAERWIAMDPPLDAIGPRLAVLIEKPAPETPASRLGVVDVRALDAEPDTAFVAYEFEEPYERVERVASNTLLLERTSASGERIASLFDLRTGLRTDLPLQPDERWSQAPATVREGRLDVLVFVNSDPSRPYRLVSFAPNGDRMRQLALPAAVRSVFEWSDEPVDNNPPVSHVVVDHPGVGGYITRFSFYWGDKRPAGHSVRGFLQEGCK